MSEENTNLSEDGRPMLSFPSMDNVDSKPTDANLPPEVREVEDSAAEVEEVFHYNPDTGQAQANESYAMGKLQKLWGSSTDENIETARSILGQYADENVIRNLENSGLGSHPDMIREVFNAGKKLQREAAEMDGSRPGQITGKGMSAIVMQKLGERGREVLNQTIMDAKMKIIQKHGAINNW